MRVLVPFALAVLAGAQPVRLHPSNPHYLQFRGKPFLIASSGEHYGAVLNRDFDYIRYLDTMRRDRMNYTRTFSGAYVEPVGAFGIKRNTLAPANGRFLAPWARSAEPGYAGGGNRFDLRAWNPEYFSRLQAFVQAAGESGIVVEFTLFCATYSDAQWKLSPWNAANNVNRTEIADWHALHTLDNGNILEYQDHLVRKLVTELNNYDNVIFEIQNEPWADRPRTIESKPVHFGMPDWAARVDAADAKSLEWQAHVARLITETEARLPKQHLIAQNYSNFCARAEGIAPGVSIVNFHYAEPKAVAMNYDLGRVIAFDESGFAGKSDAVYRQQAWSFLMAGGGLFNNLDYSFTVGHEDGADVEPNGPGGGSPALRKQVRLLGDFVRSFDFTRMKPVQIEHSCAYGTAALSKGDTYAVYIIRRPGCAVVLPLPAGAYKIGWMDTEAGGIAPTRIRHKGGSLRLSVPDVTNEVALTVVRE